MGELSDKKFVLEQVFKQYDKSGKGELAPHEVQSLHGDIRMGGISYPQVLASMKYACSSPDTCTLDDLYDLLQEMDRRYYLLQDLRWEFSLLDREQRDTVTADQARWLVQAVHGKNFSRHKWRDFLRKRAIPGSPVAFQEIEVLLCNVKSSIDTILDREEDERERLAQLERERLAEEEERRNRERKEEEKRRRELERKREEEEARKRMLAEEEERRRRQQEEEELERQREEERLRELEEQNRREQERRRLEDEEKYRDAEKILEDTERKERELEEELKRIRQLLKEEQDEKKRKELEKEEARLVALLKEFKHKRIRYKLKVAIKERDKFKLEYSINEFKTEKVEDKDMDLEKAERLLKELVTRDIIGNNVTDLRKAISRRELAELEKAIEVIKKNGLEIQLSKELLEATRILARLRKIQRIRSEILELKQSTVAEIRSYQNPPPVVHTVMTATFLILGHKERETRDWKTVQALVGKTGKEGLKRRCLECDASKISLFSARRAKDLLEKYQLDEVRDVSAGAATFYVFTVAMVEECIDISERPPTAKESPTPAPASNAPATGKPKFDPSKMTVTRSREMVTSTNRSRSKTPVDSASTNRPRSKTPVKRN